MNNINEVLENAIHNQREARVTHDVESESDDELDQFAQKLEEEREEPQLEQVIDKSSPLLRDATPEQFNATVIKGQLDTVVRASRDSIEKLQIFGNSLEIVLKQALIKNQHATQRMMVQLQFNQQKKLLSLTDANLTDHQLKLFLETLDQVLKSHMDLVISGICLNGNPELGSSSLRLLTDFCCKFSEIKVLSVERLKGCQSSLLYLFQNLPHTRLTELNISGIQINYFCIEQLCQVLSQSRKLDLRVLHLRNTKLQDLSALKLMTQIIKNKAKIKYLSMSMNSLLGYKF